MEVLSTDFGGAGVLAMAIRSRDLFLDWVWPEVMAEEAMAR